MKNHKTLNQLLKEEHDRLFNQNKLKREWLDLELAQKPFLVTDKGVQTAFCFN
jgi:hypothetical protein